MNSQQTSYAGTPPDDLKESSRRNRHLREEDTHGHIVQSPDQADRDEVNPDPPKQE